MLPINQSRRPEVQTLLERLGPLRPGWSPTNKLDYVEGVCVRGGGRGSSSDVFNPRGVLGLRAGGWSFMYSFRFDCLASAPDVGVVLSGVLSDVVLRESWKLESH